MLETLDLSLALRRREYKPLRDEYQIKLGLLQRKIIETNIPVLVVFEGWDAAGKGTLINQLLLTLDPRGFDLYSGLAPNEEEAMRPFLWRFWIRTPARGRITLFDRCWYRRVLQDRVEQHLPDLDVQQSYDDILCFERQLCEEGTLLIKFFLHISKAEQKKRMKKLLASKSTAWRVTKDDLRRHKQYDTYLAATEEMLSRTDTSMAPWTVVEAHDLRYASAKVFRTVRAALEKRIRAEARRQKPANRPAKAAREPLTILPRVDLTLSLTRKEYRKKMEKYQERLRDLQHKIYLRRIPVILVFEGWDAAGKGGNLRRLTQNLDPRGYAVTPVGKPNDAEKAHHYLWRFWNRVPKAGHIAIFDRSWYGRVLVERVEGFCTEDEWRRSYRQINEMERHFVHFGAVVLKFWLQIDPNEQLRRFQEREQTAYKKWKITEEDWRNRARWADYEQAAEEMLRRTSTPDAPWIIVESNCKLFARVKAIQTTVHAIEAALDRSTTRPMA